MKTHTAGNQKDALISRTAAFSQSYFTKGWRTVQSEDMKLLPEVAKLLPDELRTYALKRARSIVRETPGDSDTWCDPEEWESDAVELAHAVVKMLDRADLP